jgi:transcriptional regulator with XRE-family HTH domain
MLIKDQLRVRMEQLDISINELATRVGVSNQSVRHWLNGRSFPGKKKGPAVEKALSFKLDFSEGSAAQSPTVESMMQQVDVEIFLDIARLPPDVKILFGRLARLYLSASTPESIAEEPQKTTSRGVSMSRTRRSS